MSCFRFYTSSRGCFAFEIHDKKPQQRGSHGMMVMDNHSGILRANNRYRPVKTFATAVMYYHKFRLVHSDGEYAYTVSQVSRLLLIIGN